MGKSFQRGLLAVNFKTPSQVQFAEELRQASAARQERAEYGAAIIAGVVVGFIGSAVIMAAPFFGM